jgi:hypothetical protein
MSYAALGKEIGAIDINGKLRSNISRRCSHEVSRDKAVVQGIKKGYGELRPRAETAPTERHTPKESLERREA